MNFRQTLITSVCQNTNMISYFARILLEKLKVMLASKRKGSGYYLNVFWIGNQLCLLSVPLLFAAQSAVHWHPVRQIQRWCRSVTGLSCPASLVSSNLPMHLLLFESSETPLIRSLRKSGLYEILSDTLANTSRSSAIDPLDSILAVSQSPLTCSPVLLTSSGMFCVSRLSAV